MASTRLVQLSLVLLLLLVSAHPSFAHTHLGIPRKARGRKTLANQFSNKENNMSFQSIPNISGNDEVDTNNVPLEKHHMNAEVEKVEPKAESIVKAHQHEGANNKKYESKEFVEVANLMWKDYSGRARPRRKPPVHNYNPTAKH